MGVAEWHTPGVHHPVLSPNLQPMVRPFVSMGRSPPRTSVQACCGFHGCLCHGLGCHVQRACSVGSVDGTSTALAHQLPRVASGTSCAGPPQRVATWQARADPYGQYCDRCVHQPPGWSTLPPHVATRPPSPPLESEASEVASGHSHPWRAQLCSR